MGANVLLKRAGLLIQTATHLESSAAARGCGGEAQYVAHLTQAASKPVTVESFQFGRVEVVGEVGQYVMGDEAGLAVEQDAPWLNYRRQKLRVILSSRCYEKALTYPVHSAILPTSGLLTERSTRDKLGNGSLKNWLLLNLQGEFDLYEKSCKYPFS